MSREIKFRQFIGGKFTYWGIGLDDCTFVAPSSFGRENAANTPSDQYTGLKDKNGAEIYEGDILRVTRSNPVWESDIVENLPVIYESGKFIVKTSHQSLTVSNSYLGITMEVIGNIHQNPELLK